MPLKDPRKQAQYQLEWVQARRQAWFVGKQCVECGSTKDLQLDHVDPKIKVDHRIWSWSAERRETELLKCQPLCTPCHKKKSAGEQLRGEQRSGAKLVEQDIRDIRASPDSCRKLAVKYGVAPRTISRIKNRQDWSHVC